MHTGSRLSRGCDMKYSRLYRGQEKSTPSPTEVLTAKTFIQEIVHDKTAFCNIEVLGNTDPFNGVKSVFKRILWMYLFNVGAGKLVTLQSISEDLNEDNLEYLYKCLFSLKRRGIVNYAHYPRIGYLIQSVSKIHFEDYGLEFGCPYGFADGSCNHCLFAQNCAWRREYYRNE